MVTFNFYMQIIQINFFKSLLVICIFIFLLRFEKK